MASIVQYALTEDHASNTSNNLVFSIAPTSGNVLVVAFCVGGSSSYPLTVPSGFTKRSFSQESGNCSVAVYTKVSDGTETTTTWTSTVAAQADLWGFEVEGLVSEVPNQSSSAYTGAAVTTLSAGSITTTVADAFAIAIVVGDAGTSLGAGTTWGSSFAKYQADGGGTYASSETATRTLTATDTFNLSLSHDGTADQMAITVLAWEVSTGAAITSVGGDDVAVDAEQNVAFVTSGFSGEISTVQLVSGTSITNATGVTSTSGTGDFDLPDITGYVVDTVGCPLTTANNVVVARLTDA